MPAERRCSRRSFLATLALLSLFIIIALAIPYLLASKLSTSEIPITITLRVRLEGFPQRLPVRVNVYELTEKGARRVARTLLRGLPPREGLTFDLTARSALNVFAYAYDQDEGALYAASAYVAVCPEVREYVVDLAARRARPSWASGEEVPAPDKHSQVLDRQVDNVALAACSAPAGASCYVKLRGVELLVQAYEKMYWTLDPTLQAWNEEGWAPTGYVYYKLDFEASYLWSNGSLYFFPTKVDYVVATVSESKLPPSNETGPYIIRVLIYAANVNGNSGIGRGNWTPCGEGAFYRAFARPDPGAYGFVWIPGSEIIREVRWMRAHRVSPISCCLDYVSGRGVQRENFSVNFPAAIGSGTAKVEAQLGISFEADYAYLHIELRIDSDGWSKAPPNADFFVVYLCNGSPLMPYARYEP
jgi:hypothetical protein